MAQTIYQCLVSIDDIDVRSWDGSGSSSSATGSTTNGTGARVGHSESGSEGSNRVYDAGLHLQRTNGSAIPQGASGTATLELAVAAANAVTPLARAVIYGEASDNPLPWDATGGATTRNDFNARVKTGATAVYGPAVWASGATYQVDVSPVINELAGRTNGIQNAVNLLMLAENRGDTNLNDVWKFKTADGATPSAAAKLTVNWSAANDPATPGTLTLSASPWQITATATWTGDTDTNEVVRFEYKKTADSTWGTAATVYAYPGTAYAGHLVSGETAPFDDIVGLAANTSYDVRAVFSSGGTLSGSVTTLADWRSHNPLATPYYPSMARQWWNSQPDNASSGVPTSDTEVAHYDSFINALGETSWMDTFRQTREGLGFTNNWFLMYKLFLEFRMLSSNPSTALPRQHVNNWIFDQTSYDDYMTNVDPFEECYLHALGSAGARADRLMSPNPAFYMNPGSRKVRSFIRRQMIRIGRLSMSDAVSARLRFQGFDFDNVASRPQPTGSAVLEYPYVTTVAMVSGSTTNLNDAYRGQINDFLDELNGLGCVQWGNIVNNQRAVIPTNGKDVSGATVTNPDAGLYEIESTARHLSYPFFESWVISSAANKTFTQGAELEHDLDLINRLIAYHGTATLGGGTAWFFCGNMSTKSISTNFVTPDQYLRYSWYMFNLVADSTRSHVMYRNAHNDNYDNDYTPSIASYDLGLPVTPAGGTSDHYQTSGTVPATVATSGYKRHFEKGYLHVNPGTASATIAGTVVPARDGVAHFYGGSVVIETPPSPAEWSGTATVRATGYTDVSTMSLYIDGALKQGPAGTIAYAWDTTVETDASHTLIVRGYAPSAYEITASTVTVVVNNSVPPILTGTVAYTSPASGATLSGTASLAGTATGDVAQMRFLIDGGTISTDTSAPFTASLNTLNYSEGSHILSAVGLYSDGTTQIASDAIPVTIDNYAAPTVSVSSPASGSSLSGPTTVQVTASSTLDGRGALTVEVQLDNGSWVAANWNPATGFYEYALSLSGLAGGGHSLTARATDSKGQVTSSDSLTVTVPGPRTAAVGRTARGSRGSRAGDEARHRAQYGLGRYGDGWYS